MASERTVNTAGPTRQQQTISDIAPQVADSQTELQKQLLLLLEYEQDHVACTEAMMRFFFPSVVDVCKLQFSSKVYTDMIKALECNDPPSSSLTYVFRGTYPGADGKTIGSQTDRILRRNIGEANMRCIYVDEFAIVVNTSIKHFQDNGGCDVFKDPEEHIVSSELWRNTVKASDKLFMQVVKILKMSNCESQICQRTVVQDCSQGFD